MRTPFSLVSCLAIAAAGARSEPCEHLRTDDVPCLAVPHCEQGTANASDFKITTSSGNVSAVQQTLVEICYDKIGLQLFTTAQDNYLFSPWTRCNDDVWENGDVLEVFISPVRRATDNPIWYHEVDTGNAGALWVSQIDNPKGNVTTCQRCTAGNLPCKVRRRSTRVNTGLRVCLTFLPWQFMQRQQITLIHGR